MKSKSMNPMPHSTKGKGKRAGPIKGGPNRGHGKNKSTAAKPA